MSTSSTTPSLQPRQQFSKIEPAAESYGVTPRTFRNYIGKGLFPAYRVRGQRGLLVDLNEVEAAMRRLPARKAKAAFGSYGPNADIRTLPARPVVVHRAEQ